MAVELEFHQLELRYERLRVRQPARERRRIASLADAGQQTPIVVMTAGSTYVVVDGQKRVRCLRRLQRDTVAAGVWEMPEAEALIFRHLLHTDATLVSEGDDFQVQRSAGGPQTEVSRAARGRRPSREEAIGESV